MSNNPEVFKDLNAVSAGVSKKGNRNSSNSMAKNRNSRLPIYKLVPSIMTIIGMCVGLFALKSGLLGHWNMAVILLLIAGIIDGLDGKIARLLNATSSFGAQLDSLSDFLNFGVVPALINYFWLTDQVKGIGWGAALFFIVCQAIRLARFNAKLDIEPEIPELKYKFFEGVAAPMGAALSMLPMMLTFLSEQELDGIFLPANPILVIFYISFVGLLMVSRIPTFSLKGLQINRKYASLILAVMGIIVISAITEPWITFPVIGILYYISIPWCCYRYYKIKHKYSSNKQ